MDEGLYKDNPALLAYFTTILYLAYEVQEVLRKCSCFREEDYSYSHILDKIVFDTPAQIEGKFADAEKYVAGISTPSTPDIKKLQEATIARLRLMRGIFTMFKKFTSSKEEEAQKAIVYCEKQLSTIKSSIAMCDISTAKCIDQSVLFSFPVVVHAKKITEFTKDSSYDKIQLLLKHCQGIAELANMKELFEVWKYLEDLMHDSPSVLARALCEHCIFPGQENMYFGRVSFSELNIVAITH